MSIMTDDEFNQEYARIFDERAACVTYTIEWQTYCEEMKELFITYGKEKRDDW